MDVIVGVRIAYSSLLSVLENNKVDVLYVPSSCKKVESLMGSECNSVKVSPNSAYPSAGK